MRFGINTMQREALIPPGMPADEAIAYVAALDHAVLARDLHANGFTPIEISADMALILPHTMSASTIERLADLRQETGVTYTVHLPLWSVELSTPLVPVREGSVRATVDALRATLPLKPEVFVLHATGGLAAEFYQMQLPELAQAFILQQFQLGARRSIEAILAETGIPSRSLAIETIEFPFDLTLELAEDLDLSICLDTGHVLVGFSGPIGLSAALERCLPRLAEIHLHDGLWQGQDRRIGYGQDHKPLGAGDLDLGPFLDRLVEAGYAGPIIFELTLAEALASMDVIRRLRPGLLQQE